jgi:hypothetical protein
MPESNQSRKVFETSASTAREAMGKATATADQAARQVEQSYSSAADGIRDLNTKMLDIAQTNILASLIFSLSWCGRRDLLRRSSCGQGMCGTILRGALRNPKSWQRSDRRLPRQALSR